MGLLSMADYGTSATVSCRRWPLLVTNVVVHIDCQHQQTQEVTIEIQEVIGIVK